MKSVRNQLFVPGGTDNDHSPANGPSGPQTRRDKGLQCFDRLPRGLRRWTSATRTHAVVARSSPLQNEATVANAYSQPSGWSVRLLATRPIGAYGTMFSGFAGLRNVGIVQGNRANHLQNDHDGLDLLRGFSGIREQLVAGTRKGR